MAMARPVISAMLRVKNEARWIHEVIQSVKPLTSSIFVLDDHSTDGTPEICEAAGARVQRSTMAPMDEVRDKNWLYAWTVKESRPGWILHIDGDEVLEPAGVVKLFEAASMGYRCWSLKVMYLWDQPDQIRVDGIYANFFRPSFFDCRRSNGLFLPYVTNQKGSFHTSNVPADVRNEAQQLQVRLKHYGYMERSARLAKYDWYNSIDPGNRLEDEYRHMVQGDVHEIPVDAKLLHAGPLKLAPWN